MRLALFRLWLLIQNHCCADVPWQMIPGMKALALKNGNAFASREAVLLCSTGTDTARLFRLLNKSASPKNCTAASWLCEAPLSYRYRKTAVFFCR